MNSWSPPTPVSSAPPAAASNRGTWKWALNGQRIPWRRIARRAYGPTASSSSVNSSLTQSDRPRWLTTRSCHSVSALAGTSGNRILEPLTACQRDSNGEHGRRVAPPRKADETRRPPQRGKDGLFERSQGREARRHRGQLRQPTFDAEDEPGGQVKIAERRDHAKSLVSPAVRPRSPTAREPGRRAMRLPLRRRADDRVSLEREPVRATERLVAVERELSDRTDEVDRRGLIGTAAGIAAHPAPPSPLPATSIGDILGRSFACTHFQHYCAGHHPPLG